MKAIYILDYEKHVFIPTIPIFKCVCCGMATAFEPYVFDHGFLVHRECMEDINQKIMKERSRMTERCVLCGEPITENDPSDGTGMAHLRCAIGIEGGCDLHGVFIPCDECFEEGCPYRCAPPKEEDKKEANHESR